MANTFKVSVNPKVLIWAREATGFSQAEAAEKTDIILEKFKQIESGGLEPSFAQLKRLAKTYKRPTAVLFLPNAPKAMELPTDFRSVGEEDVEPLSSTARLWIRKARRKRDLILDIIQTLELDKPTFNLSAKLTDDPERAALKVREVLKIDQAAIQALGQPHQAFAFWRSKIESIGILIFQASVPTLEEFRGVALHSKEFPIILINTKDVYQARVFSILHELGHLMLKVSGISNMEVPRNTSSEPNRIEIFCNAFAAAALVPRDQFLSEPELKLVPQDQNWPSETILALARRYKVSREVILRRLLTFRLTTRKIYSDQRRIWAEEAKRKRAEQTGFVAPDVKSVAHNGLPLIRYALEGFYKNAITAPTLSELLGVKLKHLQKIENAVRKGEAAYAEQA